MATARAVQVNPANPEQSLVLWSDGRIVARGPGTPDPHFNANWDRGSWNNIGRDLIVTEWTTPSGYVLAGWGSIQRFGAATRPDAAGIKAPPYNIREDFWRRLVMDPGGSGAGYVVSKTGLIAEFGGAPAVTAPTLPSVVTPGGLAGFGSDMMRDFHMQWSTKKYVMLTKYGVIYTTSATGAVTNYTFEEDVYPDYDKPGDARWKPGPQTHQKYDAARAIYVVSWSPLLGYVLDSWGRVHTFGNKPLSPSVKPYWPNSDTARDLVVSSYPDSFQYTILDTKGLTHLVTASTPPVVTVTSPEYGSTITDTSRPTFSWDVTDAQGDAQAMVEVIIYNGHGIDIDNPPDASYSYSSTDKNARGVSIAELENDDWTVAIRVTEQLGLKSEWAVSEFTVDVVPPSTPTVTYTPMAGDSDTPPYIDISIDADASDEGCYVQLQVYRDGEWVTYTRLEEYVDSSGNASLIFSEANLTSGDKFRVRLVDLGSTYRSGAWTSEEDVAPITPTNIYWLSLVEKYVGDHPASMTISVTSHETTTSRNQGVFRPLGSTKSIAIHDGGKWNEGVVEVLCHTSEDVDQVLRVVDQTVCLLRGPSSLHKYIALNGDIDVTDESPLLNMKRVTVPYTEVGSGWEV